MIGTSVSLGRRTCSTDATAQEVGGDESWQKGSGAAETTNDVHLSVDVVGGHQRNSAPQVKMAAEQQKAVKRPTTAY